VHGIIRSIFTTAVVTFAVTATAQTDAHYSELWGPNGEGWSADSRLPDFSFAGYHRGEKQIPSPEVTHNIEDFGANGGDEQDDSDAFLKAIAEVDQGVVLIPEGRYIITKVIKIDRPNLVFRGANRDKTVLYFPKPLNDIEPNMGATTGGRPTSNYSWSGGFFRIQGSFQSDGITAITESAQRGARSIVVSDASSLSTGQEIEIFLRDTEENSLATHLYSDDPRTGISEIKGRTRASLVTKITGIDGNHVEIDRPLRFDIRSEWKPQVRRFEPTVTETGVENLTFQFPNSPYEGHFTELGNNAFAIYGAAHCWIRNIRIKDADSGGFVGGNFNTIQGLLIESDREKDSQRNATGHHGVHFGGDDNLCTDFEFKTHFVHDLGVSHCAGNVYSNGSGPVLAFDHHKRSPYENLYTNIHTGTGEETWRCGGGRDLGAHCGARGTFWNIRADNPIAPPPKNFGPWSINIVGITTNAPEETKSDGRWFEPIPPKELKPQNLHEAQLKHRLKE
jgi:hypothetical protein